MVKTKVEKMSKYQKFIEQLIAKSNSKFDEIINRKETEKEYLYIRQRGKSAKRSKKSNK